MTLDTPETDAPENPRLTWNAVAVRVVVFVACAALGALASAWLPVQGTLGRSVLFTFSAGILANAIPARIFERARFADFGLGWTKGWAKGSRTSSARELLTGLGCGAGAAATVLAAMVVFELGHFEKTPPDTAGAAAVTSVLLLIGAAGEELMFHGYAFRVLVRHVGAFATILPVGLLFGVMHLNNQNSTLLGALNTAVWGAVLGYACYRTGALWMPIGMHFGWNAMLPLAGANLSGFTIRVTGYALQPNGGGILTGGAYGPEGSLLTTLAAAALFWAVGRVSGDQTEAGEEAE